MNCILIHLDIKIKGKVKGVFFRAFTKRKAGELGIKGFIKNLSDGSVFIEAEGEKQVLDDFLKWCWEGSPASKVNEVESTVSEIKNYAVIKKQLNSFQIIYK